MTVDRFTEDVRSTEVSVSYQDTRDLIEIAVLGGLVDLNHEQMKLLMKDKVSVADGAQLKVQIELADYKGRGPVTTEFYMNDTYSLTRAYPEVREFAALREILRRLQFRPNPNEGRSNASN